MIQPLAFLPDTSPGVSEDITADLPQQLGHPGWLCHWDRAQSQPWQSRARHQLGPSSPLDSSDCCSFVWQGEMIALQIGAVGGCGNAGASSEERREWGLSLQLLLAHQAGAGAQVWPFLQGKTPRGSQGPSDLGHFAALCAPWIDTLRDWKCRVWRRGTRRRNKAKPAADLSSARKAWR